MEIEKQTRRSVVALSSLAATPAPLSSLCRHRALPGSLPSTIEPHTVPNPILASWGVQTQNSAMDQTSLSRRPTAAVQSASTNDVGIEILDRYVGKHDAEGATLCACVPHPVVSAHCYLLSSLLVIPGGAAADGARTSTKTMCSPHRGINANESQTPSRDRSLSKSSLSSPLGHRDGVKPRGG